MVYKFVFKSQVEGNVGRVGIRVGRDEKRKVQDDTFSSLKINKRITKRLTGVCEDGCGCGCGCVCVWVCVREREIS